MKSLYFVQCDPKDREHQQHLWIWGTPGTGKSCLVEALFPRCFKKRGDSDWLGYNPSLEPGHRVVYLPDFDANCMSSLKPENLKLMCDPQGFNANKKYGGGDIIAPGRVVVTSNFTIRDCFKPGQYQAHIQAAALRRRFREVHINTLLNELHMKLKPKEELEKLKAAGNFDFTKCFIYEKPEIVDLTKDDPELIDLTGDDDDNEIDEIVNKVQETADKTGEDFQTISQYINLEEQDKCINMSIEKCNAIRDQLLRKGKPIYTKDLEEFDKDTYVNTLFSDEETKEEERVNKRLRYE